MCHCVKVDFADLKGTNPEVRNCHINIGTGKEISIGEAAQLIAQRVGYKGEIRFNADKPDGTMRKLTDVSKLNALGKLVEDGLERLLMLIVIRHLIFRYQTI